MSLIDQAEQDAVERIEKAGDEMIARLQGAAKALEDGFLNYLNTHRIVVSCEPKPVAGST